MRTANIIVTSRCNQHCPFCFYADANGNEQSGESVATLLRTLKREHVQAVVITGGEPATYPPLSDVIADTLEGAFEKIAIHTNGSVCERADVLALVRGRPDRFEFVISLHGHTPEVHDDLVSCSGSFARAMRLARWSATHSVAFSVNSAILLGNIAHLADLIGLTRSIGARRATLLLAHDCSPDLRFKASMCSAVSAVERIAALPDDYLRTDGIPYCLLRNREEIVGESYWPRPLLVVALSGKVFDYTNDLVRDLRFKPRDCDNCVMTSVCMGVYREYEADFGDIYPGPIRRPQQSAAHVREARGGPRAGAP